MTELTDDDLERRLRAGLAEAARLAPLSTPVWPGPSSVRPQAGPPHRARLLALAGAVLVMAVTTGVIVADRGRERIVHLGPGPSLPATPPTASLVDPGPGPVGSWAPGSGPSSALGQLADVRADPVARASLAVQVGDGDRWVWAVAGAPDRRLRAALDSSMSAPAALSSDGRRLAVAFPGLVKVIDLTTGQVRDLPSALAGGPALSVVWSPDGAALAVLRGETSPDVALAGDVVEVVGVDAGVRRFATATRPRGLDWSPDGTRVLTTGTGLTGPDGRGEVFDPSAGAVTTIPAGPGVLVGWYDDRTVLRSLAGGPTNEGGPVSAGTTTTLAPLAGSQPGTIQLLDLQGRVVRQLATVDGFLGQLGPPLDPTRRYGLLQPAQGGGSLPYAAVVDLQTGATVGRVTDRRSVPVVFGLGPGTIIVADELPGRTEVKAVSWSTGRATPLATLPASGEGSRFNPSLAVALPR
ncbi:MAG: hypothetical protein ABIS47_08530 [Acidimicrobiales bacterium]